MNATKNLLILDLDETLIHARKEPLEYKADFRLNEFHVYRRPYLEAFLSACSKWYDLAVWSSASDGYVEEIVKAIFKAPDKLMFVWGASKTTTKRTLPGDYDKYGGGLGDYHTQKRLQKLRRFGCPLERILIVDDSPEKSAQNYGNVVYIKPFEGQLDDSELPYLATYLETLKDCRNVRAIEKRNWRSSVSFQD